MVKIIIAGSREFNNYEFVKETMDIVFNLFEIKENIPVEIICGMCRGADMLGEKFAKEKGYHIKYFPADWEKNGKIAGIIRNGEMAKYAAREDNEDDMGILVAFWDGKSRGTKNMIINADKYGLEQYVARFE